MTPALVIHHVACGPGTLGMSHFPGRSHAGAREVRCDLAAIAASGARHLLTLNPSEEFAALGVPHFAQAVAASGLNWWHVPIVDMRTPDATTRAAWQAVAPALRQALRAGQRVHVHCAAGLGRTGMLVARLLVEEGGLAPAQAIATVRAARPGTIETEPQAGFVHTGWNTEGDAS